MTDEDQTIVEEAEESNAFLNKKFEPYENNKHSRTGSRVYMKSIEQVIPYNKIALHNNKVEKYLEIQPPTKIFKKYLKKGDGKKQKQLNQDFMKIVENNNHSSRNLSK